MPRGHKIMLPFSDWPAEDQHRWEAAFKSSDRFDERSSGGHLAPATRKARRESYGRFLGFISAMHPNRLTAPPEARIDRGIVAEYVIWRRRSGEVMSLAADLGHVRDALKLICPNSDWSWLMNIIKRMAVTAPRKAGRYHLVTSDRLYLFGSKLMDHAVADADAARRTTKAHALQYRDGLVIALLALIPLRSRTLAALRIGQHLVKPGDQWALDIPAADTKTRRAIDFSVSREMSARIDFYLERFRGRIPGANRHAGFWPSNKGRPMCANAIYLAVHKRTKKAFGFGINLHRFRHAAASFWSSQDPMNVRGAKDLLGHASFGTTEKHYIMAQTRLAGRALAHAIDAARK
jgi:integrase/recombinase XerD